MCVCVCVCVCVNKENVNTDMGGGEWMKDYDEGI